MNLKIYIKYNKLRSVKSIFGLLLVLCILQGGQRAIAQNGDAQVPEEFVELQAFIPGIQVELRYFSANNFVGSVVDGYHAERVFMTREAAEALAKVQAEVAAFGLESEGVRCLSPAAGGGSFRALGSRLGRYQDEGSFLPRCGKGHPVQ